MDNEIDWRKIKEALCISALDKDNLINADIGIPINSILTEFVPQIKKIAKYQILTSISVM